MILQHKCPHGSCFLNCIIFCKIYKLLFSSLNLFLFFCYLQVGSHYHFIEANKYLQFDRKAAFGMRLVNVTRFISDT